MLCTHGQRDIVIVGIHLIHLLQSRIGEIILVHLPVKHILLVHDSLVRVAILLLGFPDIEKRIIGISSGDGSIEQIV